MKVDLVERILSKNDIKANELRKMYRERNLFVLNIMSSPGSGKTTLLEYLSSIGLKFGVIEGDLETNRDAERLLKCGIPAYQITTGDACHLEASMIEEAFLHIAEQSGEYIIIENVGNLVCPASYDLGANVNIVLLSTPEGDDKILKYPTMFLCADIVVVTKSDIMEYFDFSLTRVKDDLAKLNPRAKLFVISSKNGDGVANLVAYIQQLRDENFVSTYHFT